MRPNHLRDSDNASSTTLLFARRISVFSPIRESQRDSVSKPRVARHELPWVIGQETSPTATRLRPVRSRPRTWPRPQLRWRVSVYRGRTRRAATSSAASSGAKASRKRSGPCEAFRRCTRRGCRSATTATDKQILNAGMYVTPDKVPKGRLKHGNDRITFGRPFGTRIQSTTIPALKRRAIIGMSLRDTFPLNSFSSYNFRAGSASLAVDN